MLLILLLQLKLVLKAIGDKLDSFVKLTGFVNCQDHFTDQPKIINGASDMLVDIFGDQGRHARVAVGSNALAIRNFSRNRCYSSIKINAFTKK